MKKCPKCGSKRIAPILYGMPAFDEEMERKLNNEELFLGGCCIGDADPEYHCFQCGKDVGTPPILISKRGKEDYRKIVTAIRFSDGRFFSGYDEVLIKRTPKGVVADARPSFQRLGMEARRELTEKEWAKLLGRLYCKLYLHEWKKQYNDWTVMDGEQWELEIRMTEGRVRNYSGSNAFPPYWNELKRTFRPFFETDETP